MREIVLKYADVIDNLLKVVKRSISEMEELPTDEALIGVVEEVFFKAIDSSKVEIRDIKGVVDSVYMRSRSRYGILSEPLADERINEIMANGPQMVFVEKAGQVLLLDNAFTSEEELEDIIRMFAADVHREVNEANPIVDARLENGYRVNGVLKTVALNGPILTIRKFRSEEISLADLIAYGSLTQECCDLLFSLVASGYNIFISGGTSSGKTTFLNALTAAIGADERAIIIEDSAELKIDHLRNKVHMECRNANSVGKGEVTMEKLIKTSLRMRPDRIIVGEVRGREVIDMIQAMSTGHDGSMSTGHGNSIKGMLARLETMYLMDSQMPIYSIKSQIANAIDVFVHLKRDSKGKRRVMEVAELVGFDGDEYKLNYLFQLDADGNLVRTESELVNSDRLRRFENAN